MCPVSCELRQVAQAVLVNTGQHYDESMSGVFFRELGLPEPDYHLAVLKFSVLRKPQAMLLIF